MTIETDYPLEHLIAEKALARKRVHFWEGGSVEPPKGYKAHEKPLDMGGGMPNVGFFPIDAIDITVPEFPFQNQVYKHTNNSLEALSKDIKGLEIKSSHQIHIEERTKKADSIDIATGLQYSWPKGLPPLVKFCKDFITRTHKPAFEDWDVILNTGASDGIMKCFDAVLNPGDTILIEEFTFTPSLMSVKENGATAVPVKLDVASDSEGIDLEFLTNLLENWDTLKPGLRKPKALYTIPTGQNPTGLTQSLEFRKKIYALAEAHDFIIIEDDPYGYLTLPPYKEPSDTVALDEFLTIDEYIKNHLTPSYLEIDTKGRVIRIETFSKLFAPGLRLGFLVGHKRLIEVINNYSMIVTKFPSGLAQTIVSNIFEQRFGGVEGWLQWVLRIRDVYVHRKDLTMYQLKSSTAYEKGWIDVIDPKAGMFISVALKFPEGTDIPSKLDLLRWKFSAYGVSAVPGINMAVDKEFSVSRGAFYRITFVQMNTDAEVIEASKRFAEAIDDFFTKGLEF